MYTKQFLNNQEFFCMSDLENLSNAANVTNSDNLDFIIDIINSSMTINPTLVPTYADDAAAGVGGLTSGQLYKTTSGGSTFLKIVP